MTLFCDSEAQLSKHTIWILANSERKDTESGLASQSKFAFFITPCQNSSVENERINTGRHQGTNAEGRQVSILF